MAAQDDSSARPDIELGSRLGRRRFLGSIAALGAGLATPGILDAAGLGSSATAAEPAGAAMRATIDATHPAHVINLGQGDQQFQGTLQQLWDTVPAWLKPYAYINLLGDNHLRNVPATTDWIQSQLDAAEPADIPVTAQVANGETGNTNLIPVSQWQTWAQTHPNTFKGFNAAELYNGPDLSNYLISLFDVAGQQGMFHPRPHGVREDQLRRAHQRHRPGEPVAPGRPRLQLPARPHQRPLSGPRPGQHGAVRPELHGAPARRRRQPLVNADSSITTVGGKTLPGRSARDVRNVTLTVVGTWKGGRTSSSTTTPTCPARTPSSRPGIRPPASSRCPSP
ncbi:hypothetical protein [Streptomyces sp. NPDC051286]|uniref:hypothetical protein n=1 Tax=Streptomyces sp. NPDC051286 TaxID=3365647 RepID=UPI0037969756